MQQRYGNSLGHSSYNKRERGTESGEERENDILHVATIHPVYHFGVLFHLT